ncbi:hypothetical protein pben1_p31 [Paracoccus phage vB_PbeS_Pben1]|uniref:Uncharacterized protein n=1 Tax=Paracoccus versutus TaxID=34007 RepID=A0A3D9XPD9_PARVE|nr:hypothetical protein [Paracoccus versutus]AZV00188.1 hypothetical protein pben1_p31 [Paracoccus phage vB_PbeS_Pben1]REF72300.1 hypothetical protein BDD41_0769 [Paracoccus versutus]WGR55717.1 hypothetical protein E3U25_07005 [Paracoccus versutus]
MRKHRDRLGNAYRKGGRDGIRDLRDDLLALPEPITHADVVRVTALNISRPKFQRIDRRAQGAGSVDHQEEEHGPDC